MSAPGTYEEKGRVTGGWLVCKPVPALPHCKVYQKGHCWVFVGREPRPFGIIEAPCWHLSISHPTRLPSWDEIKDARYSLLPHDIMVAQLLPPPGEFINLNRYVMHLWEIA